MKKFIFILIIFTSFNFAQELDATVTINCEAILSDYRDKLSTFADEIKSYLNQNKFTGDVWEYEKIKCSFNIFFTNASSETNYTAQVVVTSQRPIENSNDYSLMMKVMDNAWSFKYERGQALYFDVNNFEPLTGFLNFYAYLILGLDADSWEVTSGNDFYNIADNICSMGIASNSANEWQSSRNEYSKRGFVSDLRNAKYQQFRKDLFDYHRNGLDIYTDEPDFAVNNMKKLFTNLYKIRKQIETRSVLLRTFFESKIYEIIKYFSGIDDAKEFFDNLKEIDPAHIAKYNEVLDSL